MHVRDAGTDFGELDGRLVADATHRFDLVAAGRNRHFVVAARVEIVANPGCVREACVLMALAGT